MIEGYIQPQVPELEESVLGAILIDREAIGNVADFLTPEMFYVEKTKIIYTVCMELHRAMQPVELIGLTQALRESKQLEAAGGAAYVTGLTSRILSISSIEFHARIIYEKYILRRLGIIGANVHALSFDTDADPFTVIEHAEKLLFDLTKKTITRQEVSIGKLYQEKVRQIDQKKEGVQVGISFGFSSIGQVLRPKNQNLIIVAARPGMGKTAFALSSSYYMATAGVGVGFFSMEMSQDELCSRYVSLSTGIPHDFVRDQTITGHNIERLVTGEFKAKDIPLYIDDSPALTVIRLLSKARRMVKLYQIQILIVDYLQLMRAVDPKGKNRNDVITEISGGLKFIAKELNIPVVALSQLSRDVEKRGGDMRPTLSDLRDGGTIEQDADAVGFLYRPSYYHLKDNTGFPVPEDYAEFMIEKNRGGKLERVKLKFNGELMKYSDPGIEYVETQWKPQVNENLF